jgi:hypothetical protein
MTIAGEVEGTRERRAVDRRHLDSDVAVAGAGVVRRRVELLDHGEEVGEELLVRYGCFCPLRNR